MDNDQAAALFGRTLAQGLAIEMLLALALKQGSLAQRNAIFDALRGTCADAGPSGSMSDIAAVFMGDARVNAASAMEGLIERTQAILDGKA